MREYAERDVLKSALMITRPQSANERTRIGDYPQTYTTCPQGVPPLALCCASVCSKSMLILPYALLTVLRPSRSR